MIDERNRSVGRAHGADGAGGGRILTAEAIGARFANRLGARYALRHTDATVTHTDSVVQPLASSADYAGAHLDVGVEPGVRVRADGRLLHERMSGVVRWDAAPQVVVIPMRGVEVAAGYRVGDLHDVDFAVRGGTGWFVTLGAAVTEQSIRSLTGFWRERWSR